MLFTRNAHDPIYNSLSDLKSNTPINEWFNLFVYDESTLSQTAPRIDTEGYSPCPSQQTFSLPGAHRFIPPAVRRAPTLHHGQAKLNHQYRLLPLGPQGTCLQQRQHNRFHSHRPIA